MKKLWGILVLPVFVSATLAACNVDADNGTRQKDRAVFQIDKTISVQSTEEDPDISAYKQQYRTMKARPTISQIKYGREIPKDFPMEEQIFPKDYTAMEGILTFRGNPYRTTAAWGQIQLRDKKLEKLWDFNTSFRSFGGGGGWTGQPAVIKWPEDIRKIMNIKDQFKDMADFTEVIFASLDGRIYFFELHTGESTREPIDIKNTIKGSVAIDPRGFPLLYAGQGLNESGEIGYRIFSLIDSSQLFFLKGNDSFAYRRWGAFDGSPLINKDKDTMIIGGENGLLYRIKLDTDFNLQEKRISISPEVSKYHYKVEGSTYQGIENSIAVYENIAYFADNSGSIQAVNLNTLTPRWAAPRTDDTDATITIKLEEDTPYLYTGCEVDKQGSKGLSIIRKIDGITGDVVWAKEYPCYSILGEHPVNGGMLATNVIGKNEIEGTVIFTLARYGGLYKGLMVALDCKDGRELWRWEMPDYAWSSPVDVYDENGKAYIIQGDSAGKLHLLDGKSGTLIDSLALDANIESSPVVFENTIIVATRGGKVYGIKMK